MGDYPKLILESKMKLGLQFYPNRLEKMKTSVKKGEV